MQSTVFSSWKPIKSAVLLVFALSAIWVEPARAQTKDGQQQDIQQLKDKLQQMDQMMEEVKAEITALELQGQQHALASTPTPGPTQAKQKPAQPEPLVGIAVEATSPQPQMDPVPLEGEITEPMDSFNIYGFTMLDAGYDFGQVDPSWYDVVRPTKLPSYHNEFAPSGNVYASVRQTRFGVKTSTPTPLGDLNTIFEFELFGTGVDAGQTTFRLRHAYGELGQFGAGQTWSPFMDIDVFPNTLEYWGPNGMVFFRNIQARWMPIRSERGSVTIALERPGASGDQGIYAHPIGPSDVQPRGSSRD